MNRFAFFKRFSEGDKIPVADVDQRLSRALSWVASTTLALALVACSAEVGSETGKASELAGACAEQQDGLDPWGNSVVLCTKLHDRPPFVRVNVADDWSDPQRVRLFGGVNLSSSGADLPVRILDREGSRYLVVNHDGTPADFRTGAGFPSAMHLPSNRVYTTIYEFEGTVGPKNTAFADWPEHDHTIRISAAVPVIQFAGEAIDRQVLGTWNGTVSKRLLSPQGHPPFKVFFDAKDRVPVRIIFDQLKEGAFANGLPDWSGEPMPEQQTLKVHGRIANMNTEIVGEDGVVYPSLEALGEASPFFGASSDAVTLHRATNMHGIGFDNHWVLTYPAGSKDITGNGMSNTLDVLSPVQLIARNPQALKIEEMQSLRVLPHIPYSVSGHVVELIPPFLNSKAAEPTPLPAPEPSPASSALLFTEYLEGEAYDKVLEITNVGHDAYSIGACSVEQYTNGSTTPKRIALHGAEASDGTLKEGQSLVLCHSKASAAFPCTIRSGTLSFNGDDALVLRCEGVVLDSLGKVGDKSFGASATIKFQDSVLQRRCDALAEGDTTPGDTVNHTVLETQWTSHSPQQVDDLGKFCSIP